jgi:WD40 repeat protein
VQEGGQADTKISLPKYASDIVDVFEGCKGILMRTSCGELLACGQDISEFYADEDVDDLDDMDDMEDYGRPLRDVYSTYAGRDGFYASAASMPGELFTVPGKFAVLEPFVPGPFEQGSRIRVKTFLSTGPYIAALTYDGTLFSWHISGKSFKIEGEMALQKHAQLGASHGRINSICATKDKIFARTSDGVLLQIKHRADTVECKVLEISDNLPIVDIATTYSALVYRTSDGRASSVPVIPELRALSNIKFICSTPSTFATMDADGTVMIWGKDISGPSETNRFHVLRRMSDAIALSVQHYGAFDNSIYLPTQTSAPAHNAGHEYLITRNNARTYIITDSELISSAKYATIA